MLKSGRSRKVALAALALAVVPVLAACSSGGNAGSTDGASGGSGEAVNIAYVSYTGGDIVEAYTKGAQEIVEPNGGSVTLFNANFDPQVQVTQCQDAITSGRYNAIILAPVDPATAVPCVVAAKAANIPVGTLEVGVGEDPFTLEPQVDGVVAVVASPLTSQTEVDRDMLTGACAGANPCKVIAEIASPNDRFTNARVDAITEQFGPDIEIVAKLASNYDPGEITKQLPDLLTANPDANVFMASSDISATAALPVLTTANVADQVKVTGLGGTADGAKGVADGTIYATTGNWPIQYGAFLASALTQAVNGETVDPVSLDMYKADTPVLITQETVADFTPEWGLGGQ